ncbi:olfactory receptor 146-like [Hyla sarda]|uniref:olfactory receptor 146-like n=1 Tax=Hyla sarda TaxID=327740 RepID=UPI0024C450A0|nr:olfactory receptor 146-like [Hyla sarda]
MIHENTTVEGFILLGFSEYPDSQILLFFGFLTAYSLCVLENMFLIVLVCLNSQLHTPMYFFVCNLAFLDICLTTLIHPKFLLTFLNMRSISFHECMGQLYLYISFQSLELFLLTVMSYERYVAICNPLRYNIILNKKVCVTLTAVTWMISLVDPAPFIQMLAKLNFCKSDEINHFLCDSVPLLKLSCESISRLGLVLLIEGIGSALPCFLFTLSSYISIIFVILKIQSAKGRRKAFSTCSAHLTVVCMLYVTLTCVYIVPPSSNTSVNNSKTASLLNTVLIPILNPLLYSLRNKEIQNAFLSLVKQKRILTK